ncbi:MAG TPA: glutamate-5-semialdehyde dehydrogenase [Nitrospinota bacterium]|nr:glutamate-5-semialdehyde dehydrogenase [Nitrospinota bacterium]
MDIKKMVMTIAKDAKIVSQNLRTLSTDIKNNALLNMANSLEKKTNVIIDANKKDIKNAKKKRLSSAMIDRLTLNPSRVRTMSDGLREVVSLPDPVGEITRMWKRPNNLQIGKIRVPIGVIGIIYESRPNVTVDTAGLALKAGNAIILRGGSEAIHSNITITKILREASKMSNLPVNSIQLIDVTDRTAVYEMLKLDAYIDLVIPRGGFELINMVVENSRIPVIKHDKGLCHIYIDNEADLKMAEEIAFNAKVQRPGVCNAMETLLVNKEISETFLPSMAKRFKEAGVEIRGCPITKKILPFVKKASKKDWETEYLDLILSIKVVKDIKEAIDHIATYSSGLAEAIVTTNYNKARTFLNEVDSSSVFVNASTRFTDGNQFGLGAEMGISTQKLHVRGPMGLEDLTTTKYIILGNGQIRR